MESEADIEMLNNVLGMHSKKVAEVGLRCWTPDCQSFRPLEGQNLLIRGFSLPPYVSCCCSCFPYSRHHTWLWGHCQSSIRWSGIVRLRHSVPWERHSGCWKGVVMEWGHHGARRETDSGRWAGLGWQPARRPSPFPRLPSLQGWSSVARSTCEPRPFLKSTLPPSPPVGLDRGHRVCSQLLWAQQRQPALVPSDWLLCLQPGRIYCP